MPYGLILLAIFTIAYEQKPAFEIHEFLFAMLLE
jgi:hypothetical protein